MKRALRYNRQTWLPLSKVLLILPILVATRAIASSGAERTLLFPEKGFAVGEIFSSDPISGSERAWKNRQDIGPARGAVHVPSDKPACLVVGYDGIEDLKALTKLKADDIQVLSLKNTQASAACLKQVAHLRYLKVLDCSSTDMNSDALAQIAVDFPQLEGLDLARSDVSDAGLDKLGTLKHLSFLSLHHNKIADAGVLQLSNCKQLLNLNLRGTNITDESLKCIRNMSSLQDLNILGTLITEKGLLQLQSLKGLKSLTVSQSRISDSTVAAFRKALPGCTIHRRPDSHGEKE